MTRDEAVAESARLGRESPDRASAGWFPRQEESGSGSWSELTAGPCPKGEGSQKGKDPEASPEPRQKGPLEAGPLLGLLGGA